MVEFARQLDPMPFHTDGGSVSGIYILALKQRLVHLLPKTAVLASFGYNEVRLHEPVRPGDTLALAVERVNPRPSPTPASSLCGSPCSACARLSSSATWTRCWFAAVYREKCNRSVTLFALHGPLPIRSPVQQRQRGRIQLQPRRLHDAFHLRE
jgi:hypothetical protein